MQITFSPMRQEARLTLERQGDILVVNGAAYDFADLAEGASETPASTEHAVFASPVTRRDGRLRMTLILSYGPDAPRATLFPDRLTADRGGPLPVPPWEAPLDAAG